MVYRLNEAACRNLEVGSRREWLLTNGIGGFAMGTASGANTRRYHGLLVAAIHPPAHRMVLLANVEAFIETDGLPIGLSTNFYQGSVYPEGYQFLDSFAVGDHAEWNFRVQGAKVRKRIGLHQGVNAVTLAFDNTGDRPIALTLRPLVCHKYYHDNFRVHDGYPHVLAFPRERSLVEHDGIPINIAHPGAQRAPSSGWYYRFLFDREIERGLDGRDDLFCPCELRYELSPGEGATIVVGDEDLPGPMQFSDLSAPAGPPDTEAVLGDATRYFLVKAGDRSTVIAGYPWFTDWGRDTMIALPGLCVCMGRLAEAKDILDSFAGVMNQGLIPNRFLELDREPEYNTVDATLWFANAVYEVLRTEWDPEFAARMKPRLDEVFECHTKGTRFGIKVDEADGLLTQGEDGVQLTWMDAKVGEWVITPRRGKAIEICGLWIHALGVMQWLADRLSAPSDRYAAQRSKAMASFHRKFWKSSLGYYLDVADPDDASLRPNQMIPFSLEFGPAPTEDSRSALKVVTRELLTPVGLRTLAPSDTMYCPRFEGPLRDRDAAYHQGTVWPWLLGPFWMAHIRMTGDTKEPRRHLKKVVESLHECGLGGFSEVYDGDEPRRPGGCPWQAWNIAEILRVWRLCNEMASARPSDLIHS
ncbi:MAG: hypothetical protein HONBIEJF_01670 [Fimbriimonadaceae bacterium]|nr:hypothetical protein [Fimbriimonadaceae bacterium]